MHGGETKSTDNTESQVVGDEAKTKMSSLLLRLLLRVGVHAVDLDHRRALRQVRRDNHLRCTISERSILAK